MAFVKTWVPRTSQPQDACGVDWSNPLTKGLIALYSAPQGLQGVGGVGGELTNLLNTGTAVSATGVGWVAPSVGNYQTLVLPNLQEYISQSKEASLVMPLSGGNMTTQGFTMFGPTNPSFGDHYPYSNAIYTGALSATTRWVSGAAPKVDITQPHVFAAQARRGQQRASQNGITLGTAALNEDPAIPTAPTLLRSANTSYSYSGLQHALGLWDRYLSDAEVKALADNFWQLFEPEEVTIWMPGEVGAGGPATVIPVGLQAVGAVGTPTATGQALAYPAGLAAAASIGAPMASGGVSIVATGYPAGVGATAGVGTPTATGAAKALPVGVQVLGSTGTPLALGGSSIPATVLPAGVASLAYMGTPLATGQARAYPFGVQAAAAVGAPIVLAGGAAVAQPLGVQATASVGSLIAKGAVWTVPGGVQALGAVGEPTAIGATVTPATAYPQGVQARGYVGSPVALDGSSIVFQPAHQRGYWPAENRTGILPFENRTGVIP